MFLRIVFLLFITDWCTVNCLVPVPAIYRKAELALSSYASHASYDPIIHSLLNVLIHIKRARAFITNEAIEMALENVKKIDQKSRTSNEPSLRQAIYGIDCKPNDINCSPTNRHKTHQPTPDLKQRIALALDKFFGNTNADDYWPKSAHDKVKA